MNTIFHAKTEPGLLAAIEANFGAEMAGFGRSLPSAELHEDAELQWFLTGPDGPNGVLNTTFANTDTSHIQKRIADTLHYFQQRGVREMHWSIGSTSQPTNLISYLQEQGLSQKSTTTCLLMSVEEAHPVDLEPDGLLITEVTSIEALEQKRTIEMEGFGTSAATAQQYHLKYLHDGFGPGKAWQHYIGWQNGKAVAVASLLLHSGVAGIYGVTTLSAARRRGFGTALTYHAIREAGRLGYHLVVLSPTEMSIHLYQRLGFKAHCQIQHYGRTLQSI